MNVDTEIERFHGNGISRMDFFNGGQSLPSEAQEVEAKRPVPQIDGRWQMADGWVGCDAFLSEVAGVCSLCIHFCDEMPL